jgi:hypothetical protein
MDETKGHIEGETANAAIGQHNRQSNVDARREDARRYDQRDDRRGGNVTFQNQDNAVLWNAIVALGDKISEVRERLDSLPERVAHLELKPVPIPISVTYPPLWVILVLLIVCAVIGAFFLGRIY